MFAWALIGYVSGCMPSTWIVARIWGSTHVLTDVRRDIGEADAHLLLKRGGGSAATVASAMDVLKAFVPVLVASRVTGPYAVAACSVGAVAGHCWPPVLTRWAGRGLAGAAGAFLGFLPLEMTLAGIIRVGGGWAKVGGLASTIGFVAVPLVAWYRRQPVPYVVAALAINVLIFVRRLEGVGEDVELGVPRGRAIARRIVLDASAHAGRDGQLPM